MKYLVLLSSILCLWTGWCECVYFPEINLGTVDLSHNPKCMQRMDPHISRCTRIYRYGVQKAMENSNFSEDSEAVRRATCCGVLSARLCYSKAARSIADCHIRDARAYEKLPIDADAISTMNRHCSGYYLSSKLCSSSAQPSKSDKLFISRLVFILIILFLNAVSLT